MSPPLHHDIYTVSFRCLVTNPNSISIFWKLGLIIQWNLVRSDASNPETSKSGHNFTGPESPNNNSHRYVHDSFIQKKH